MGNLQAPTFGELHRPTLYKGEESYFKQNPEVTGMAAEDGRVIINPYSTLSDQEKQAVYLNEAARLYMRANGTPSVALTDKQKAFLDSNTYSSASDDERIATILARIISGDQSAMDFTDEQKAAALEIHRLMEGGDFEDGFYSVRGR